MWIIPYVASIAFLSFLFFLLNLWGLSGKQIAVFIALLIPAFILYETATWTRRLGITQSGEDGRRRIKKI